MKIDLSHFVIISRVKLFSGWYYTQSWYDAFLLKCNMALSETLKYIINDSSLNDFYIYSVNN